MIFIQIVNKKIICKNQKVMFLKLSQISCNFFLLHKNYIVFCFEFESPSLQSNAKVSTNINIFL